MVAVRGMTLVPGGSFQMGSTGFYAEERPVTEEDVDDLWVDVHPVTNAEFRRFVKDTGWVTVAEQVAVSVQVLTRLLLHLRKP